MLKKFVSLMLCLMIVVSVAVVSFPQVSAKDSDELRIRCGDTVYAVRAGDKVTFAVDMTVQRLFENIQVEIKYDSDYLKVVPVESDDPEYTDWDAAALKYIPYLINLGSAYMNIKMENMINFNASRITGYDFKEKRNLVFVEFTAEKGGETEIEFDIYCMWIKGGEEAYFDNGIPKITEGIEIDTYIRDAEEYTPIMPTYPSYDYPDAEVTPDEGYGDIPEDAGILYVYTANEAYEVRVGEKFRYDILLEADKLFETLQARVDYPSDKLRITLYPSPDLDMDDWEYQSLIACPNILNAVANLQSDSVVRFNGSNIYGYNFKDEKVLLTLEFTALAEGIAEINETFEELIVKGGSEAYFDDEKAYTTEGISIKCVTNAKISENPPERPTEPPVTYPTVEGDVTVHFKNTLKWENVYCYTYVDGENREDLGSWPGTPCETNDEGVWTAVIPGDCTHVVFNDGDILSTDHLLNPLEEKIATRSGGTRRLVNGHWRYSYGWSDYDPNPTYPTFNPDQYYPPEVPDDIIPGETVPGEWNPATPDEPDEWYPEYPTYSPTGGIDCTVPPSAGDTDAVVKPQGKPDTPQSQEPKPTQGATSDKEVSEDTAVDVPVTGANVTVAIPVMLIGFAGLLTILRRREAE